MPKRNFVIYCDESLEKGRLYSHFYGGALVDESDKDAITEILNAEKARLHFHGEVKWQTISKNYQVKYIEFIDKYFDFIAEGRLKIRIMFKQNIYVPTSLQEEHIENQYFLLYYQMIKHAFGLRYCNPNQIDNIHIKLLLDDIPDTRERFEIFKDHVTTLSLDPLFRRSKVTILRHDIADVRSHDHVILQGLDMIMGSMQFRLNDKHKEKPTGARVRGNRTRAKEAVYKHINARIRAIYPNFNIGISTGTTTYPDDYWLHPYRHWNFIPSDHRVDPSRGRQS
jgi:Protein of unknown function (DUF3800)